ncbi:hypothetical protein containing a putative response regulator receiver (CheY-like) domain [Bradyrhizobium sp. ORS 278]|nr:hypothetical protein containing a putative response regulator receiver (CheY-like) domain [Bradyrhizobium sp. ORS 278]
MSAVFEPQPDILLVDGGVEGAGGASRSISLMSLMPDYKLQAVRTLDEADACLRRSAAAIVVLNIEDLNGSGGQAIERLRSAQPDVPIIVVNGPASDGLRRAYLQAGAQRYIAQVEVGPGSLSRAVRDLTRRRAGALLRQETRRLAAHGTRSDVARVPRSAGRPAPTEALRIARPAQFEGLVDAYAALFDRYPQTYASRNRKPAQMMLRIVSCLGEFHGGPRDLVDIHMAALQRVTSALPGRRADALVVESRLLALEMMGLLASHYRDAHRCGHSDGSGA